MTTDITPQDFDIEKELEGAGIDADQVYEPYKQARGRITRDNFLNNPPTESDVILVRRAERGCPSIRELADKHVGWLIAQRGGTSERLP